VDEHGMFAGEAELRAFDAEVASLPVDLFLVVVSGQITITESGGQVTTLEAGQTCAAPRGLTATWSQPQDTRIFFMCYAGPSPAPAGSSAVSVIVPRLDDKLDPIPGPSRDLIISSPLPTVGRKVIYEDPTGQFTVGLWEATPYQRKLAGFSDYEIMHFIEGGVEMTNAIGETRFFKPRETFIVNRGVPNAWKTKTYTRKVYCKLNPKQLT
jgi:uncharacterized cupin superfamily protein